MLGEAFECRNIKPVNLFGCCFVLLANLLEIKETMLHVLPLRVPPFSLTSSNSPLKKDVSSLKILI